MISDKEISTEDIFVLYGTESSGLYMSEILNQLGCKIYAYVDSSESKQGDVFLGKTIYSPKGIYNLKNNYTKILIASSAQQEISEILTNIGFKKRIDYIILPI